MNPYKLPGPIVMKTIHDLGHTMVNLILNRIDKFRNVVMTLCYSVYLLALLYSCYILTLPNCCYFLTLHYWLQLPFRGRSPHIIFAFSWPYIIIGISRPYITVAIPRTFFIVAISWPYLILTISQMKTLIFAAPLWSVKGHGSSWHWDIQPLEAGELVEPLDIVEPPELTACSAVLCNQCTTICTVNTFKLYNFL